MKSTKTTVEHGFSRETLLKRLAGDEELCDQLISIFVKTTDDDLESLRATLNHGEFAGIPPIAHKIKGACLNVGARGISDIMHTVESYAKSEPDIARLQHLVDTADRLLAEMIRENKSDKNGTDENG
jgi:HPt (histidine-containing phosphotransfer) domain-containing protein